MVYLQLIQQVLNNYNIFSLDFQQITGLSKRIPLVWEIITAFKNPLILLISEDFWSEWPDSNRRPQHPKCRALPTALHPDKYLIVVAVMVKHVVKSDFWPNLQRNGTPKNQVMARVFGGLSFGRPRTAYTLPNVARYQLRYTPKSLLTSHYSRTGLKCQERFPEERCGGRQDYRNFGTVSVLVPAFSRPSSSNASGLDRRSRSGSIRYFFATVQRSSVRAGKKYATV